MLVAFSAWTRLVPPPPSLSVSPQCFWFLLALLSLPLLSSLKSPELSDPQELLVSGFYAGQTQR